MLNTTRDPFYSKSKATAVYNCNSIAKTYFERILRKYFDKTENSIFYINGADTLPTPLSSEEESALLNSLYNNGDLENSEIRNTLIERNLRLVVFIAKKFENTGIGLEDLISIGTIGLIKAINTFRTDKNIKLATYASRCIENEILMYIRKNNNVRQEISIDEPLNVDWDGNELLLSDILGSDEDLVSDAIEKDEDQKMIATAIRNLNERERLIIRLRFGLHEDGTFNNGAKEMTQKEVADLLGISQSYISRLEKKIIRSLKAEIGQHI